MAIRVRVGMLTDATGETCEALVTGEEAEVSLGGVCTGFTCRERRREEIKKEIKKRNKRSCNIGCWLVDMSHQASEAVQFKLHKYNTGTYKC